jgi:vacuolar-type H+-ATPase subunit I/STV1
MKGLTALLSLVAVIAAGASAMLYFQIGVQRDLLKADVENLTQRLRQTERRASDLAAQNEKLAASLAGIDSTVSETRARNTTLEARNAQLARELLAAREQAQARDSFEQAATAQIAELRRQLVEAQSRALVTVGPASTEQVAAYEARIADLEAQLAALRRISGGASSPATAAELAAVPAGLSGHVVEVGPRSAFVVLDIGSRHGAVPALELVIRRGSAIVAHVRVTDVRDSFSIAHVLPGTLSSALRAGDTASRS